MQEEKVCIECGEQFVFTEGEQKFYTDKEFAPPKRCSVCRKNRKNNAKNGSGDGFKVSHIDNNYTQITTDGFKK